MSWLLRHNWLWRALAVLFGAAITWILLIRRDPRRSIPSPAPQAKPRTPKAAPAPKADAPAAKAKTSAAPVKAPAPKAESPAPKAESSVPKAESPASKGEAATLFDVPAEETAAADVPAEPAKADAEVGPYGVGSIAAPVDGSMPDGYTIKGNAQSMLFHTTDSPYYGRTKPEVWFRTEADAAAAGFTKYERRRKK